MSLLLVLVMIFTMMPSFAIEAAAMSIDDSSVFLKQSSSGKCTLASAAMMLRRRAIIDGNVNWVDITESAIRSTAWIEGTGLRHDFTYAGMIVGHGYVDTLSTSGKKDFFIEMLRKHPDHITFLAPLCTFFLTVLVGTGHVVYTLMPIICDIAPRRTAHRL